MKSLVGLLVLFPLISFAPLSLAEQSTITEADGEACMGQDKSRRQTEEVALDAAKRLAVEYTSTHLTSQTTVENYQLKQDIVKAFNAATVKVLKVVDQKWANPAVSDCYTIRIKAEVIPSPKAMSKVDSNQAISDPRLPLTVKLWVNARNATYAAGQDIEIYLQGNKPFYARLVYEQADGTSVQLLPNQHRTANYFAGGPIFEVPTPKDDFVLTVGPPFGKEHLVLYASTSPLGKINAEAAQGSSVYLVKDKPEQVAAKTRGITINSSDGKNAVAEFAQATVDVTTQPAAPGEPAPTPSTATTSTGTP